MLIENEDYELITVDHIVDTWAVRYLKGDFVETVITIGSVAFNEVKDHWGFNFDVVETPDPENTVENEKLQEHVARTIEAIIYHNEDDIEVRPRESIGEKYE
jgi:hypothetical protein